MIRTENIALEEKMTLKRNNDLNQVQRKFEKYPLNMFFFKASSANVTYNFTGESEIAVEREKSILKPFPLTNTKIKKKY